MESPDSPPNVSRPLFLGVEEMPDDGEGTRPVKVIPVPYEKTTTYMKGTSAAPDEIVLASHQVELYDDETGTDLSSVSIRTESAVIADDIDSLERELSSRLTGDRFPVLIGGEHTITLAAARALLRGNPPFTVLSLDAHADLRNEYLGTNINHATVMRRISEFCPVVAVGVRSISGEEMKALPDLPATIFFARDMLSGNLNIGRILDAVGETVYVSVDFDVFDPGTIPAVGTPEPGGLDWHQVKEILRRVIGEKSVVGMDFVELCPHPAHHASSFIAAKLIYKAICYLTTRP